MTSLLTEVFDPEPTLHAEGLFQDDDPRGGP
jgi:hypothetical protein